MAHYAFINDQNIVTQVITGKDEGEGDTDWEEYYGNLKEMTCLRTSYNGNIRKNFAGIGFSYDEGRDAFIPPKPFPSWTLDEETCQWVPPSPQPEEIGYEWDEDSQSWNNENLLQQWRQSASLTRRKFMLAYKRYPYYNGTLKQAIDSLITTLLQSQNEEEKEMGEVMQESLVETTEFTRNHEDVIAMATAIGMNADQIDAFFEWAENEEWRN